MIVVLNFDAEIRSGLQMSAKIISCFKTCCPMLAIQHTAHSEDIKSFLCNLFNVCSSTSQHLNRLSYINTHLNTVSWQISTEILISMKTTQFLNLLSVSMMQIKKAKQDKDFEVYCYKVKMIVKTTIRIWQFVGTVFSFAAFCDLVSLECVSLYFCRFLLRA